MAPLFLLLGALNGALSVALGAFGAHALRQSLDARALEIFETAVRYQATHALVLLGVALLLAQRPSRAVAASGWAFTIGIAIFSGSLYLLALTGTTRWGAVAPVGGTALVLGWLLLGVGGGRAMSSPPSLPGSRPAA